MKQKKLTDYKNFWLIWLTSAGDPNGITLFKIQKEWNIKTNYLYHKESGLKKPLVQTMIEEGYLDKVKNKLAAKFDWIPEYVIQKHKDIKTKAWSPGLLIIEAWPKMQNFVENHRSLFFSMFNIKLLYRNDINSIRKIGFSIFNDIFLIILTSNIIPLCKKYKADIVIRIIESILAFSVERNLYDYYISIKPYLNKKPDLPRLIRDEKTLLRILAPL